MEDNESRSGSYHPEAFRSEQPPTPSPEASVRRGSRPKSRVQRQREVSRRDFLALSLLLAGGTLLAERGVRMVLPSGETPAPTTQAPAESPSAVVVAPTVEKPIEGNSYNPTKEERKGWRGILRSLLDPQIDETPPPKKS